MTYKLSPSSLNLMFECKRCFWLTQHKVWKRPASIFPSLPSGMDKILKIHFDKFRDRGEIPPELKETECENGFKLFEDKELLILDKPSGWIVNDATTTRNQPTVQGWLRRNFHFPISNFQKLRNGIVHRLDKETSGLLLIAKTKSIFLSISMEYGNNLKDTFYVKTDLMNENSFLKELAEIVRLRGKIHHLIFLQRFRGNEDSWRGELEVSLNATRKIIDFLKNEFDTDSNVIKSIIMVSSVAGNFANNSQPLSYSIAKAGLNHMVKYYAAELGASDIRVNGVSPIGFIKEESRRYYLEENKKLNALYQKIIPLRRMCMAEDITNVISFLCSSKASFISGQNIIVDGGLSVVSHETLAMNLNE